jgi:hypothetical protein
MARPLAHGSADGSATMANADPTLPPTGEAGRRKIAPSALPALWRADAERLERYGPSPAVAALRAAADQLEEALSAVGSTPAPLPTDASSTLPMTWRERLWLVPDETRLGVREVAEALGRSADFVYRHTGAASTATRIPHRKLDGELVFTAGEVRDWIRRTEIAISCFVPALTRSSGTTGPGPKWRRSGRGGAPQTPVQEV